MKAESTEETKAGQRGCGMGGDRNARGRQIIEKLWLFENRGKPQPVWAELSACHA